MIEWNKYMGCSGWFKKDGLFVVAQHSKAYQASTNEGPIWTVIGEKGDDLVISVNMVNTSKVPKQYVRVI